MGRAAERRVVSSIVRDLSVVDLDGPPVHALIADRLHAAGGAHGSLVYSTRCEDSGSALDTVELRGTGAPRGASVRAELDAWIRRASRAWAMFDPRSPEPAQRNRAIAVGSWRKLVENEIPELLRRSISATGPIEERLEAMVSGRPAFQAWGAVDAHQLRVLVCDGPALLAWVGILEASPGDPVPRRRLEALVPALQKRLALEARLAGPADLGPALLDALAAPAWVLDARGRVVLSNAPGHAALASDRALAGRLRDSTLSNDAAYVVQALATRGIGRHHLVLARAPAPASDGARRLAGRFALTRRETEVLEQIARGRSNRGIAVALACGERTVETHARALLRKTGAESRAALAALVWATAAGEGPATRLRGSTEDPRRGSR